MAATTLKDQALGSSARLASKIITGTRDLSAVSGDVAYTGVGFVPTSVIAFAYVNATKVLTIGFSDSSIAEQGIGQAFDGLENAAGGILLGYNTSGGNYASAVVKTYDADGFTLTWTKTGSPTGTLSMMFLCLR